MSEAASDLKVFEALKSLAGAWRGVADSGRTLEVAYSIHANGSVLMEAWRMSPTSDALTLYHMDLGRLMATHYCPLCNQPRLVLSRATARHFVFDFVSATDLADLEAAHQHGFELSLPGDGSFWRSETYLDAGMSETEAATFRRV